MTIPDTRYAVGDPPDITILRIQQRMLEKKMESIRHLSDEVNNILYATPPADLPNIGKPADAATFIMPILTPLDHEEFWIMCLNYRHQLMAVRRIYSGTINQIDVRVAEVFRVALLDNAALLIVAHNHPSGVPDPSPEDIALTKLLADAGKLLEIELLDHLIFAPPDRWKSLREMGVAF